MNGRTLPAEKLARPWGTPAVQEKLAPIVAYLQAQPNFGSQTITARYLAEVTADLLVFCEQELGCSGQSKSKMAKLPASLFADFSKDGALSQILCACLQHKIAGAWPKLDFKSESMKGELLRLVAKIENNLKETGLLSRPVCYISDALPPDAAAAAAKTLEAKGARVVTSPEGATHTIGPDPAGTLAVETADTNALRELERKQEASEGKTMCRVHWWYYPDSCTSPPPAQCLFAGNP